MTREYESLALAGGDAKTGRGAQVSDELNTIFNQEFLLGIVEESHAYRNVSKQHMAALTLMTRCVQRVAVTATPIFTSTRVSPTRVCTLTAGV